MPKIEYVPKKFSIETRNLIDICNDIFAEYQADGYIVTLRQLYYQCVSRAIIPNNMQSYKRLGSIINDGRLGGLIDWELMEDRTRNLRTQPAWTSPADIIAACARQYAIDKWLDQEFRPEVWIEKDALGGVFERVCDELQVPWFSCRGYTSQSEMWVAGQRLLGHIAKGQTPKIFHFGDHDPSGIDMSRDIQDRITMFLGEELKNDGWDEPYVEIERVALSYEQVEQYNPPPNPAKTTDSRASSYISTYGNESWELDALPPDVLADLVRDAIAPIRDQAKWDAKVAEEEKQKAQLVKLSQVWGTISKTL